LQTESVNPRPGYGLRRGALLVSGAISLLGGAAVLFLQVGTASDARIAATWSLIQFLSGVWAGVLGANNPFLHGLIAGVPALLLGLVLPSPLPPQFVLVAWFIAPCAALVAGMIMRFMRKRAP
jgi:hypothetical protein